MSCVSVWLWGSATESLHETCELNWTKTCTWWTVVSETGWAWGREWFIHAQRKLSTTWMSPPKISTCSFAWVWILGTRLMPTSDHSNRLLEREREKRERERNTHRRKKEILTEWAVAYAPDPVAAVASQGPGVPGRLAPDLRSLRLPLDNETGRQGRVRTALHCMTNGNASRGNLTQQYFYPPTEISIPISFFCFEAMHQNQSRQIALSCGGGVTPASDLSLVSYFVWTIHSCNDKINTAGSGPRVLCSRQFTFEMKNKVSPVGRSELRVKLDVHSVADRSVHMSVLSPSSTDYLHHTTRPDRRSKDLLHLTFGGNSPLTIVLHVSHVAIIPPTCSRRKIYFLKWSSSVNLLRWPPSGLWVSKSFKRSLDKKILSRRDT